MKTQIINMNDYHKFILLMDSFTLNLEEMLKKYSSLTMHRDELYAFHSIYLNEMDSMLIACPDDLSFYHFHHLVLWLASGKSYGIMLHKEKEELSYYCHPDPNDQEDETVIGYFNTNTMFYLHVPSSAKQPMVEIHEAPPDAFTWPSILSADNQDYFSNFPFNEAKKISLNL
ncbi:hypothetical protein FACS189418_7320 [Clostridia bacterium]|nr:hypothetical protein FACS189418_7320 [Clostridia bacterium]